MKIFIKRIYLIFFLLFFMVFTATQSKATVTITGTCPEASKVSTGAGSYVTPAQILELNSQIQNEWDDALERAREEISKYDSQPKLAESFSNSNTYVSHAATQRGYQGYDLFALTVGGMAGIEVPSTDSSKLEDEFDKIEDEGDVALGAAIQIWSAHLGINIGKLPIVPEDLYLGLKFGTFSKDFEFGDDDDKHKLDFDALNWGLSLNYQLIKQKSLFGLLVWRGISLGSGFLFQSNKINYELNLDPKEEDFVQTLTIETEVQGQTVVRDEDLEGVVTVDPSINLGVESTTYTIPLEVMTGVRLLYIISLSLGAGVDLNFGSTDIILKSNGNVSVDGEVSEYVSMSDGDVLINGSTKDKSPSLVRPRVMANAGIGIGPVVLDVPVSYYFNNGYSVGASVGIVW